MKSKAKRMIRKQNKYGSNKDAAAAAIMMSRKDDGIDEEELERLREEKEERIERNRTWRLNKERDRRRLRGEVSDDDDSLSRTSNRTSSTVQCTALLTDVRNMLTCSSCQDSLDGGKVWQCGFGHPVCRKCVDISLLSDEDVMDIAEDTMSASSRKSSKSSISSFDRLSSISDNVSEIVENMTEQELLDLLETSSESTNSSRLTFSGPTLAERDIKAINWYKNSIKIRKDAIPAYKDYHNNSRSIFPEVQEGSESDPEELGKGDWDVFPKDEIELHHDITLKRAESLILENLSDSKTGSETTENSTSTQQTFSAHKPEVKFPVDWYAGTIQIKKDVIRAYDDYHEENEDEGDGRGVTFKPEVDYIKCSTFDDDTIDSASTLETSSRYRRSNICQDCEAPIVGRNLHLEMFVKKAFGN